MKRYRLCFVMLLLFLMWPFSASAELEDAFGVDELQKALPEQAEELLGDALPGAGSLDGLLAKLWQKALDTLRGMLGGVLRPAVGVLAVVTLCAAADGLVEKDSGFDYVNLCGCLAVAVLSIADVQSLVALGRETMEELSLFSKALLPTLSAVAAAAGAVSSAPAKYAAAMLFLDLLISAANTLVFPLICAYLATLLADAALPGGKLGGAVKLVKWACGFVLTALVTAFTAYLSLTGLLSSGTDALAVKATKTALSTALPVVGGIVSDAAGSLVAGAGVLRASVGVLGLLAVLAVCLSPFLSLGLRYLLFKAVAALASVIGGERLSRLIDGVAGACGMILSLVGTEAVLLFISIISLVKAVSTA